MPPEAQETAAPTTAPSEEAERAALIAELDAEDGDSESTENAKVAKADSGDTDSDEGEPEGDVEDSDEDDAEGDAFEGADEFRDHVKGLLEAGDMRKVEEALGLEKGALKLNGAKFRYVRQATQKAADTIKAAEAREAKAQSLVDSARSVYGPMVEAKQMFHSGTPQGVQKAARFVESHFGVPLTQFVEAVVKAGRGEATPSRGPDPEVAELKQTVQRLLEERNQQQTQAQQQMAEQRHLDAIKGKLGGTPLAKLPDGAKVVYEKIKGSYDRAIGGYRLNLRDAIAEAQKDPAVKWKLHELSQKRAAPASPEKPPAVVRKRPAVASKAQTPAESEAAEKARLIAELEAEERKSERAARRSNARR